MRKPQAIIAALLTTAAILLPGQASAWQRPGHAAGAAMTYDELARTHPEVVRKIVEIAAGHPDRARFDAALGEAKGAERDRRLFMEMARWPDDVRESPYDHPAWHYWMNPYSSPVAPPPHPPQGTIGEAREAFALNLAVARDESVALRERALKRGMTLSDYGLFPEDDEKTPPHTRGVKAIASKTEEDIYKALELPYVPPEIREARGELNLKATPKLIRAARVQEVLQ